MNDRATATAVCALDEVAPGTARQVNVGGHLIAVVRIGDQVYAVDDTCTHANVSLSEGEVLADTCEIECWKHGSAFDLKTGHPNTLPATVPVRVYEAWVQDGYVMVAAGKEQS
jgi:3-phenylpropionate/trans-cinnamate dioxygenase ferredoxin subunit